MPKEDYPTMDAWLKSAECYEQTLEFQRSGALTLAEQALKQTVDLEASDES